MPPFVLTLIQYVSYKGLHMNEFLKVMNKGRMMFLMVPVI